jgi:hypothetical protein
MMLWDLKKVDTYCVESVIDDVLEIFAHSDLPHQLVLVTVHAGQLAHVSEDVLQTVGELERVHVVQAVLEGKQDINKAPNAFFKILSIIPSR